MAPGQEDLRRILPHSKFGQKVRSWFEAWVNQYLGNRHVARAVIRYGCTNVAVVTSILGDIATEKVVGAKKRKLQDEAHGAGEPVWQLRGNTQLARKALRYGERRAMNANIGHATSANKGCWTTPTSISCMPELIMTIQVRA